MLDLTARNRLLNFKPSTAKSLQIIEAVPNAVFDRLLDGKTCTFMPIPDPVPGEYVILENRRVKPEVRDCDVKEPEKRLQVLITGGQSNFDQGIINEATPLAKTLLDSSERDEVQLALPGKEPRTFKVLKIERNGKS